MNPDWPRYRIPRPLRDPQPQVSLWQRFVQWLNTIDSQYRDGEG